MLRPRTLSFVAWTLLAFVTFATLSPYSLRPELTQTEPRFIVTIEHVGAFGLLGLLFAVSYPERLREVWFIVLGSAVALELAQALAPDRHARLVDALEKIVGGGAGILLGIALLSIMTRLAGSSAKNGLKAGLSWLGWQREPTAAGTGGMLIGLLAVLTEAATLVALQNLPS